MNSYDKLINEHWAYISKLLMTYEISGPDIGEGEKNYKAGMKAGYLDAKCMSSPDGQIMHMVKHNMTVKNAFQFSSAYLHGMKHGHEDIKLGIYKLDI